MRALLIAVAALLSTTAFAGECDLGLMCSDDGWLRLLNSASLGTQQEMLVYPKSLTKGIGAVGFLYQLRITNGAQVLRIFSEVDVDCVNHRFQPINASVSIKVNGESQPGEEAEFSGNHYGELTQIQSFEPNRQPYKWACSTKASDPHQK